MLGNYALVCIKTLPSKKGTQVDKLLILNII